MPDPRTPANGPLVDCHIHSRFSCDASGTVDAICAAACTRGLTSICLTEHVDLDPRDAGYGFFEYREYRQAVDAARARWADGLDVLCGVEIDYQHKYEDRVVSFLSGKTFDFVVGSVHWNEDAFFSLEYFTSHEQREAYEIYFRELGHLVRSGLVDCLGHLDYVKRYGSQAYGPFDFALWRDMITDVLLAATERDVAIELNLSGLRQHPQEAYPGLPVLQLYRRLGGQILTMGSDSHRPQDVGRDISLGLKMAREAGFDRIAVFVDRKPVYSPLELT